MMLESAPLPTHNLMRRCIWKSAAWNLKLNLHLSSRRDHNPRSLFLIGSKRTKKR